MNDKLAPIQYRHASFSCYYPKRTNGWNTHRVVFDCLIGEFGKEGEKIFIFRENGDIEILKDGYIIIFDYFWKGRAPWGYHFVSIIRNPQVDEKTDEVKVPRGDECGLHIDECRAKHSNPNDVGQIGCVETGYWFSDNGHVTATIVSKVGDRYAALNKPAHIQGTPAIFEMQISAYLPTACASPSSSSFQPLSDMIRRDAEPDEVKDLLTQSNFSITYQNCDVGSTALEILQSKADGFYKDKTVRLARMRDLLCINFAAHIPGADASFPLAAVCWNCKAAIRDVHIHLEEEERKRILREDESLFGVGICSLPPNETFEKASEAALQRGVCVRWLENFTRMHDCWAWPTWRVVQNIIKPATAHSRVRYIHLPGVASAAKVGKVDVFVSHAWGGNWGSLVAAALTCLGEGSSDATAGIEERTVRVYIDVFAVRQWPGNVNDIVFEGVVKEVNMVLVVVSASDLVNVSNLNFKDISDKGLSILSDSERRAIPFLRIWCLAELNCACENKKDLVICCGSYCIDIETKTKYIFKSHASLLYHLQFLVDVEHAKALMPEDEERILTQVRQGVGYEAVNRNIRGAICGSLVSSKCSVIRSASLGNVAQLKRLLHSCYIEEKGASKLLTSQVHFCLCAAVASGFISLFDEIMSWNAESRINFQFMSMKDTDGLNPLMHAVRGGQTALVQKILPLCTEADVNALNNDNWTSLAFAAQSDSFEIMTLLLASSADVSLSFSGGVIALGIGCQNNFSYACCDLLLEAGSDVHHRDGVGYTTLRHAVTPGKNPKIVKAILSYGADPNSVDNWGQTILFWALDGTMQSLEALLKFDPSVEALAITTSGKVYARCDVNLININSGISPLDAVIGRGNQEMVDLLRSYGALTIEEMVRQSGEYGSGKLSESCVAEIMQKYKIDLEQAGLVLSLNVGRLDWALEQSSFPKPFDILSADAIRRHGFSYGIVTRAQGWNSGDVDGGDKSVGYLQGIKKENLDKGKVFVRWTHSGVIHEHSIGADGKFELCYAPYRCAFSALALSSL